MNIKSFLLTTVFGTQIIFSNVWADSDKIRKIDISELRGNLEERCLNTDGCDLGEMDTFVSGVEVGFRGQLLESNIKAELKDIRLDPVSVIKKVSDMGVAVAKVTVKSGEKVIEVISGGIDNVTELPGVDKAIENGEDTLVFVIEGTYEGVKKITTITVDVAKKLGLVKPVKIVFNTTLNVASALATGTLEVIHAFFRTRPVVIIMDGVEFVANIKPVKYVLNGVEYIAENVIDVTLDATEVIFKGAWRAVKYTSKGAAFVVGVPVSIFKWLINLV